MGIRDGHAANPCLRILISGGGFRSLAAFADSINRYGREQHGLLLTYGAPSVRRWIDGGGCDHPEVVAGLLSTAWGVPIPPAVIWPEARSGGPQVPAYLQAWVPTRTLEELGIFLRSDMLTRRALLAAAIEATTGSTLTDPLLRWLELNQGGLSTIDSTSRPGLINQSVVESVEQTTQHCVSSDAAVGGGLSREAALGRLKWAVDLMDEASYDNQTGNRMLAAIAKLAGEIGYMSHDAGMDGPAQRYFVYGLQAARESTDERAPLIVVAILGDMIRQLRALGDFAGAERLTHAALAHLPSDSCYHAVRAMLWSLKGRALASMGASRMTEAIAAIDLSFELSTEAASHEPPEWLGSVFYYLGEPELRGHASYAYLDLAEHRPTMAAKAEAHALDALLGWKAGFVRERSHSQIDLARARFAQSELEQACADGRVAISLTARVTGSARIRGRLGALETASAPYAGEKVVGEFRDELRLALA